ncbi:hypothetical protein NE237_023809 [Protea cynaroides]|uniref:NAD(P)H dehydrogenase (quinone) n=1 Tax=Protea cynaroides TaxID=273540 RepID=A0A9Q0HDM9_9MAGN|nr:hypothetical protein NE237_023809 [Protea cynaroides]
MEQIPETLPKRILEKMKGPPKADDVTMIKPEQLVEADGFLFGFPSRFGMMAAQCQAFFDSSHELEDSHPLADKLAGIFWSTDESLVALVPDALTSTTNPGAFLNSEVPRETPDLSLFSPKPRTVDSSRDVDLGSKIMTSLSQSPVVAPLGLDPCRPPYNESEKIQDVETVENLEENIVDIQTNVDSL